MDANVELLNYIYQNAQMGVETMSQLVSVGKDEEFNAVLRNQLSGYQNVLESAKKELERTGHDEKGIGLMAKVTTHMSIGLKTIKDSTPSHISEMLIQGSTMGVIDATKNIKQYAGAEPSHIDLAKQLLELEENSLNQLKSFL